MLTDKSKTPQEIFLQEGHAGNEYGVGQDAALPGMVRYLRADEDYRIIQGVLSIAFMRYLDESRPAGKMCLSNAECADIHNAFICGDWDKLFRYAQKYCAII